MVSVNNASTIVSLAREPFPIVLHAIKQLGYSWITNASRLVPVAIIITSIPLVSHVFLLVQHVLPSLNVQLVLRDFTYMMEIHVPRAVPQERFKLLTNVKFAVKNVRHVRE